MKYQLSNNGQQRRTVILEKREANKTSTYKYLSSLPGEIPSLRKGQGNPTESGGLNELKSSEFGEAKAAKLCGHNTEEGGAAEREGSRHV